MEPVVGIGPGKDGERPVARWSLAHVALYQSVTRYHKISSLEQSACSGTWLGDEHIELAARQP